MLDFTRDIYTDPDKAREHLEQMIWPNGPICPHCGNIDQTRISKSRGKSVRPGLWNCKECHKPFSVTVGTVFERSHVPLNKWVLATHLMAASKKGVSAHQLHRMLGVTYKTAWFMAHRIREAMRSDDLSPMGGSGKTVEVDETYIGKIDAISGEEYKRTHRSGPFKNIVLTLVERGGSARSFRVDSASIADLVPIIRTNIRRESALMSDNAVWYKGVGREFASHGTVNHQKGEYGRGNVHSNTVEGYYSIFKRGVKGIYQHVSEKHLHRYLAEFDFRYSHRSSVGVEDAERANQMLAAARGKRLTYRRTSQA